MGYRARVEGVCGDELDDEWRQFFLVPGFSMVELWPRGTVERWLWVTVLVAVKVHSRFVDRGF